MNDSEAHLQIGALSRRLAALERKVDFMLTALKLDYQEPPEPPYMAQVRALAAQRKVIDAIKVYRENTGASLVDAKNFVENM
jgi:ribosomal protein L7/L12